MLKNARIPLNSIVLFMAITSLALTQVPLPFYGRSGLMVQLPFLMLLGFVFFGLLANAVQKEWAKESKKQVVGLFGTCMFIWAFYLYQHLIGLAIDKFDLFSMLRDSFVVCGVAACFSIQARLGEDKLKLLCWAILCAYPCLVLMNVLGYAGGLSAMYTVTGETGNEARILSSLGLNVQRIQFPFIGGINAFGVISGAGVISGIAGWSMAKARFAKLCFAVVAVISAAALVAVDSRGAILGVFFALIARQLIVKPFGKWVWVGLFLYPILFPFIIQFGALLLDKLGLIEIFSRQGGRDALEGLTSSRSFIWGAFFKFEMQPGFMHVFGYGADEVRSSGLYEYYQSLFRGMQTTAAHSLHNGYFQLTLGMGWLCVLLYSIVIFVSGLRYVKFLQQVDRPEVAWVFSVMLFFWIMNAYEACTSLNRLDLLSIWVVLLALGLKIGDYLKHTKFPANTAAD